MRLTKRAVDQLQPSRDQDRWLWDDQLNGFGVRVKPSGVKSYFVQYRNRHGRTRRITLGRHGVLAPDQARNQALGVLASVAAGADPSQERQTERRPTTFASLADRYLEEHARLKKKPKSVKDDAANLKRHILPRLGPLPVEAITRADIARLHHDMRATPIAANRVVALLSKVFNLAEVWGLRPNASNPCSRIQRYRERRIERFLSGEEFARLAESLQRAEDEGLATHCAVTAIRLLVFTGCRLSEILSLRWEHVHAELQQLRLPDSKTGRRLVPLNAPAVALLAELDRNGSPWVFPAERGDGHLVNLTKPWYRIRSMARLDDVRLHDLRHTFASVGAGAGLGLPMIGKLLGHTQAATTQRYAHLADDPLRRAAEEIGSHIETAMRNKARRPIPPRSRQARTRTRRSL